MKPRARRVTIGAVVLAAILVVVLLVANWSTARDHVEAWWFQLSRETETIPPGDRIELREMLPRPVIFKPDPTFNYELTGRAIMEQLAAHSRTPVVVDVAQWSRHTSSGVEPVLWRTGHDRPSLLKMGGRDLMLLLLGSQGIRVIEQRFPRRAYIVIRAAHQEPAHKASFIDGLYVTW